MELTDEAWQLVTSQPRVTGFLGGKGKPVPITNSEAERLIHQMSEGVERPRATSHLTSASRCAFRMGRLHRSTVTSRRQMTTRRA